MINEHDIEFEKLRIKVMSRDRDCGDMLINFQLNTLHHLHIDDVRALVKDASGTTYNAETMREEDYPDFLLRQMQKACDATNRRPKTKSGLGNQ